MTPQQFIAKYRNAELKERSASQSHFNDLCRLLGVEDPISADPKGEWFTFENNAYGWGDDYRAGLLTDDEILARLFRLNQERSQPPG